MFDDFDRLVDDVFHVLLHFLVFLAHDQFFHVARVQVHKITGTSAVVGEVLDGEAEAAGAGGTDHEPFAAAGEVGVVEVVAEFLVVDFVVIPADALLRQTGGAAGFEDVEGPVAETLGHEAFILLVAQPVVLEVGKFIDVGEGGDFLPRVPSGLRGPIQPEGAAGFRIEVPLNHSTEMGIEIFGGSHDGKGE